jgi:xanthine dehydrogenase YagS FAD-binding subunit
MKKITHINAKTLSDAVSALGANAEVIAGGTDLLGYMKAHVSPNAPETLVNIKSIPDMDYIKEEGGMLKIGALAKLTDIAKSSVVQGNYTALAEAAHRAASPELRNMGTIGGNICQRVRCWYYRVDQNSFDCLRKNPSGICWALLGDNRYNSIFGAVAGCVAVNPSDIAPALVALSAKIVTTERTFDLGLEDVEEYLWAVRDERTTKLNDDEIVTEIQVPTPASGTKSAFVKFALRESFDFPIVNCAAAISSSDARICLNAVHNLPRRATEAEGVIAGQAINDTNAEAAGAAEVASAVAIPHNKYMIQIAKVMVKRAILACA